MADRSIAYRFLGHDAGLGKTMSGLGDKSEHLHKTLGKLAGAFGAGLTVGGAAEFLKGSINNASDLNESLSKTRVVFGQASKGVEVFAKAASRGIGQSEQQALEATSTFGNLFRALGIGTKPAADLSVKIVKLAGDLASFNNTNPADALEALKSGLLGEAEPLRKYGVTLSAVRVQAEAMADGIVKPVKDGGKVKTALLNVEVATNRLAKAQKDHGAKSLAAKTANDALVHANEALAKATKGTVPELNAAQKAQASYNIIMKDTKTAQGDFARTSGGLANQQRILKAEFADASAQLGTKLYPAATKVVSKLADALQPGSKFTKVLGDLGDRAKEFADDAKPIFTWVGDHPHLFTQIAKDAVILGGALKAKSFLTGMGLLKGVRGGSKLGGAVGVKTPVPVFVTNAGFAPGGKTPVPVVGGKLGTAEKVGAGALLKRAVAGPVGGIGVLALTGGDEAKGGTAKQQEKAVRLFLAKNSNVPKNDPNFFKLLDAAAGKHSLKDSDKFDKKPQLLAQFQFLQRYGQAGDKDVRKAEAQLLSNPTVRAYFRAQQGVQADRYLDDPKRGRALHSDLVSGQRDMRGSDLTRLLSPVKQTVINNFNITANGVTSIESILAEARRMERVAAVGGSTPATRDRRG